MSDKALPDWVKVEKKIFDRRNNEIQNTKNKNKFVVPEGSGDCINANDSNQLIQGIENSEITHEEALKEIFKVRDDIDRD